MTDVTKVLDPDTTYKFTWQSTVAPDAAPVFSVRNPLDSMVSSFTAQQSADTSFYALFTTPNTNFGPYLATWRALKTVNGSAYAFRKSLRFTVLEISPVS